MDSATCPPYAYLISITSAIYTDYSLTDSATALCYVAWVKRTQIRLPAHYSLASDARPQEDPIGREIARSGRKDAKPPDYAQELPFMLSYFVYLCTICVVSYNIRRTKDYKPRGRAPEISTIFTCFSLYVMIYCPLPHPISVRKGWGITVVYLCGF
jgi:hypothetical protein